MRNLYILLVLVLSTPFCQGQMLVNENGLQLIYDGNEKLGSRYEEKCKVYFDTFKVKGTVINNNDNKAAHVTAILNFWGSACENVYSNDGPVSGEIVNKLYQLDIPNQTKHQTQYWVNRFVHLLPKDSMKAYWYVEVIKDQPCPEPEFSFTYELIPEPNSTAGSEQGSTSDKPVDNNNNNNNTDYASLIIGEWNVTNKVIVYSNGRQEETGELFNGYIFKSDGTGEYMGNGEGNQFEWTISDNKIKMKILKYYDDEGDHVYENGGKNYEELIAKLDGTTLIVKGNYDDNSGLNYWQWTYKKESK